MLDDDRAKPTKAGLSMEIFLIFFHAHKKTSRVAGFFVK
ncbi:hypothetical protein CZ787_18150 [Halomonas citrativorans]|uniref:Uncharacterized protein n=1 Tax=Halomonas citrativorans TaxID=2742612 RepID=A0A1R4I5C6_9GAMM|nr:hypothetical protein CZ787_18150 [Halomonas citrativorans]